MNATRFLSDWVRTLTGQRRRRALPPRSNKPAIGARIVLVDVGVRLTIPAGVNDALWAWLLDAGWRVQTYRPDRRKYRNVSRSRVEQLLTVAPALRARLLGQVGQVDRPAPPAPCATRQVSPSVHAGDRALDGVRFLKATEIQGIRFSSQRPGSRQ